MELILICDGLSVEEKDRWWMVRCPWDYKNTYLEQARQTVLRAKELMLFPMEILLETNIYNGWMGPLANIKAFREELPGLFKLAKSYILKSQGVDSPKLANSEPYEESYIYSFMGMLGIPLKPVHEINKQL